MRYWISAALVASSCALPLPVAAQDAAGVATAPATLASPGTAPTTALVDDQSTQPGLLLPTAPAALTDRTSMRSLVGSLHHDLRRVATRDQALILVGAGAAAAIVHPFDTRMTRRVSSSPAFEHAFDGGQIIGGTLVQVGGSMATFALGRALGKPRVTTIGADLVRAQLVNAVFTQGLKLTVNRQRPDGDPFSLPSGHSSGTFASATVLQRHLGWKVGVPAYAVAAYVAGSRLQEQRHYASDVILGAGIGIVAGRAVTVGRGQQRFAVAPAPVPGGAVVRFTRLVN
jgi:membrane-associated phospholipid phosphatase